MIKAPEGASYSGIIINTRNFNLLNAIKSFYNEIMIPIPIYQVIKQYCSSYGEYMYLFCYTTNRYYKIQLDKLFVH